MKRHLTQATSLFKTSQAYRSIIFQLQPIKSLKKTLNESWRTMKESVIFVTTSLSFFANLTRSVWTIFNEWLMNPSECFSFLETLTKERKSLEMSTFSSFSAASSLPSKTQEKNKFSRSNCPFFRHWGAWFQKHREAASVFFFVLTPEEIPRRQKTRRRITCETWHRAL